MNTKKEIERLSAAYTLSDMEIFIFPELFYPLVLANIMSPLIWEWRDDPWFRKIEKKGFRYRVNRIKQYIIDHYVFNLDLATWGLTTKDKEIERFRDFFDIEHIRESNALFGYEGDKYYFDIDIRKHFGLDKFNSNVIPYWKTETIEAMTAFQFKEGYITGAGECVSLSALYAAAMFVIGRIPLENIFMIATPLHSQNFILEKGGLLTNNRRIVTKNMWFNGTSLTDKARRALDNEKVSVVAHSSGYIHTLLPEATIDKDQYSRFSRKLKEFLTAELSISLFINFLRFRSRFYSLFQFECECSGKMRYITLEKLFEYEHSSNFSVLPESRDQLIKEIEGDEFHLSRLANRILLNDMEDVIRETESKDLVEIENYFLSHRNNISAEILHEMFTELKKFLITEPRLPENTKIFINEKTPVIEVTDNREAVIKKIIDNREQSETAQLTLFVYRQMDLTTWIPFVKAAIERNPICYEEIKNENIDFLYRILEGTTNVSIYDGNRLAQPDEVWNFKRGDGIEKAFLLANFIHNKDNSSNLTVDIANGKVVLKHKNTEYNFLTSKSFKKFISITGNHYIEQ